MEPAPVPPPIPTPPKKGLSIGCIIGLILGLTALLLGSAVYLLKNVAKNTGIAMTQADIRSFESNLNRFHNEHLRYPTQQEGLEALVSDQLLKPETLIDPWGHKYRYRIPGLHNPSSYDVFSIGPDGVEGTADDMGNW